MSTLLRSVDPAEENDADDEGEIWYNPIPEDEEPEISHPNSIRLLVPPRSEPQRRPSRGGDVAHGGRNLGSCSGVGLEAPGESPCGSSGDASQGNAVHSTEAINLHRRMLACKPQEEGGPSTSRATGKAKKRVKTSSSESFLLLLALIPCCLFSQSLTCLGVQCLRANCFCRAVITAPV